MDSSIEDPLGILLLCLAENEVQKALTEFHEGICGGHYSWRATTHKILRASFYWPKLYSDTFAQVRACDKCQRFVERQKLAAMPLIPIHVNEPFQKWGLDFIGEIHPPSSGQHRWILTATG